MAPLPIPEGFEEVKDLPIPEGFEEVKPPGNIEYALRGLNLGLARTAGAPVDLTNLALSGADRLLGKFGPFPKLSSDRPVGGGAQLQELATLGGFGLPRYPVPERARPYVRGGGVVGESLPFAMAPLGALRLGARPSRAGYVGPILRGAEQAPGRSSLLEIVSSLGAGGGGAVAEAKAPDSPLVGTAAEVAGGAAGGLTPLSLLVRGSRLAHGRLESVKSMFGRSGREFAAADHLQKMLETYGYDPQATAQALRASEDIPGLDLTAGQKSGNPVLLALDEKLARTDPKFASALREKFTATSEAFDAAIREAVAGGSADAARELITARAEWYEGAVGSYVRAAEERAARAIEGLRATGDRAGMSRAVSDTLEDAHRDVRAVEQSKWEIIPKDTPLPPENTNKAFAKIKEEMLPNEALPQPLEPFLNSLAGPEGVSTTSGYLLRLRSRALARAREARAADERGLHRHLMMIADGALADLSTIPGVDDARDFSRALNTHFTQGVVGDALGFTSDGGRRIDPDLLLSRTIGTPGEKAGVAGRDIEAAAQFGGRTTVPETEQYLKGQFEDRALKGETLSPAAAERYMADNRELLEQYPAFRTGIEDALQKEHQRLWREGKADEALNLVAKNSVVGRFIAPDNPVVGIGKILKGPNPATDFALLARIARRSGPEGAAGLRDVTFGYLLDSARRPDGMISGKALRAALTGRPTPKSPSLLDTMTRNGIVGPEQQRGMMRVIDRIEEVESALNNADQISKVLDDPDLLSSLFVRLSGAALPSRLGLTQGVGAGSIVMAHAGSQFMQDLLQKIPLGRTQDFVARAAADPGLMAALLSRGRTPAERKMMERQVNAYLLQTLVPVPTGE